MLTASYNSIYFQQLTHDLSFVAIVLKSIIRTDSKLTQI